MAPDTLQELKREAQRLGVAWADVEREYALVKWGREQAREREREIRRAAWHALVGSQSGSAPFWRHGFLARYGRQLARGADYTCVPGYDDIRQTVAAEFPEFEDPPGETGRGCERLFDLLFRPYTTLPTREEMLREALARIEAAAHYEDAYDDAAELLAY